MRIVIGFEQNDTAWDDYVRKNAARASELLSRADFIDKVQMWSGFDNTSKNPSEVADAIRSAADVRVRVGYFPEGSGIRGRALRAWNRVTKAIADENDGLVRFNRQKKHLGAGSPGNIAHEAMHVLGFSHRGNERGPNINTVPYRIGEWVDDLLHPGALALGE